MLKYIEIYRNNLKYGAGKAFLSIIFILYFYCISTLYSQNADTNWAKLGKKIAIQPGLNISAWLDRGIVSNMKPVGDGTYIIKLDLTPGYYYNFLFYGDTTNSVPDGLSPNYTYYDQVPSKGRILTSTSSNGTGFSTNYAYYGAVGDNYDARRVVYVPEFGSGTNFYVFNNFSDKPLPPEKFDAIPQDGQVILNWNYPKGNWGQLDANVIAGGSYYIYTNTSGPTNNFGVLTNLKGNITSFTHTGLVNGTTYYYFIVSSDAYTGVSGTPLTNMRSASNSAYATPNSYMPVYFKVQDIRWDYVKKHQFLVWLTPSDRDGRSYWDKVPGRVVRCVVEGDKDGKGNKGYKGGR